MESRTQQTSASSLIDNVTVELKIDTKGMNYHEDFEFCFDVEYCNRDCSASMCAGSGLSITERSASANVPRFADSTAVE